MKFQKYCSSIRLSYLPIIIDGQRIKHKICPWAEAHNNHKKKKDKIILQFWSRLYYCAKPGYFLRKESRCTIIGEPQNLGWLDTCGPRATGCQPLCYMMQISLKFVHFTTFHKLLMDQRLYLFVKPKRWCNGKLLGVILLSRLLIKGRSSFDCEVKFCQISLIPKYSIKNNLHIFVYLRPPEAHILLNENH